MTQKTLPHNTNAEKAVLASCLMAPEAAFEALGLLSPADFYSERHQLIFKAVSALVAENKSVDVLTVNEILRDQSNVSGGLDYLSELEDLLPTAAAVRHHADLVKCDAVRRNLVRAGDNLTKLAWDGVEEPHALLDAFQASVFDAALDLAHGKGSQILGPSALAQAAFDQASEWAEQPESARGVQTGFARLDGVVRGLKDVNIITASTGVGKTAFALNLAVKIGVFQKIPTLFLNCEMNIDEVTPRLQGILSGIPLWRVMEGRYDGQFPFQKIAQAAEKIRDGALHLSDNRSKNINAILALIRKYKAQHGVKVVILDYLGEIEPDTQALKESEYITYGRWVQSLKNCCVDAGVKLVLLAQLNREGDSEPSKTKIAGSWKIAQKADVFMILSKDKRNELKNDLTLRVDKNRNGVAPVNIDIGFEPETQRMTEVAR